MPIKIPAAAVAGSTLTQAYAGENVTTGSFQSVVGLQAIVQRITLASATLLASVDFYMKAASSSVGSVAAVVYADAAGPIPKQVIGYGGVISNVAFYPDNGVSSTARWVSFPMGLWLTAGSYWLAFACGTAGGLQLNRIATTGGTARTFDSGGAWVIDGDYYLNTATTNRWSIRASTVT